MRIDEFHQKLSIKQSGYKLKIVRLPTNLNISSVGGVVRQAITSNTSIGREEIAINFEGLRFADPVGVVGLGGLVRYLLELNSEIKFSGLHLDTEVLRYLDSAGFIEEFLGKKINEESILRSTTVPYVNFRDTQYLSYLYGSLTPWIAREVNLSEDTISTIRTCLEEAFHNIEYHSGVASGCTMSQHFPQKKQLKFALADYGRGIPSLVRTILDIPSDARCIRKACEEGFTTKTNVRNRGAGLAILIRYVVERNGGSVELRSHKGYLRAYPVDGKIRWETYDLDWAYPGTLVHVTLRTDTLERLDSEVELEVFQW